MRRLDWLNQESKLQQPPRKQFLKRNWQPEFAQAEFDDHIPASGQAHHVLVVLRFNGSSSAAAQTRIILQEPDERVRIQQQPHSMYSLKSSSGSSKSGDIQKPFRQPAFRGGRCWPLVMSAEAGAIILATG